MNRIAAALCAALLGLLLLPTPMRGECQGVVSVPPAETPPGVRMVQYSSSPIVAGQEIVAQRNCYLLVNAGGDVLQTSAQVFLSEEGGFPGPWFLDPGPISTIDLADGAPASCTVPGTNIARIAPASGFLAAGSATDACCFEWFSINGTCTGLPAAGNVAVVQTQVGASSFPDTLVGAPPGIPSGGVTCGLIGLEALLVLPFLRRRARGRRSA
ncbi:MAG: hypothetical protein QNK05_05765 [Myxococcota bacterium]|nr:hypothetical protein [Myxococcota bacterium]